MILSAKLFEKCEMYDTYSETGMAWKLVHRIQQHGWMAYRLGSKLLTNAFRSALVKPTFFGPKDQLPLQDHPSVFRGSSAKPI